MKNNQRGIGLIEVLVALMLLAIAILGFTAMQMNAVKATDESVMRTRAMTVIRGGSEIMRSNLNAIPAFVAAVNATGNTVNADGATVSQNSCTNGSNAPVACTPAQLAAKDGLTLKSYAASNDLQIRMVTCPGTVGKQERQCFIASWGKTAPQLDPTAPPANTTNCADANGVYKMGSQCFIMESY